TWYEGENYHLFAHRGLWYAVSLSERAACEIPSYLRARYLRAFETPFLSALPDFTFPSRRDSQYRVSLRQWRIAESCELGLAEAPSEVLGSALRELYRTDVPEGDTGRGRSTAEAERNVPAARLTRADLGWKSLLFAREQEPAVASNGRPKSVLLREQGLAILRRDEGRSYVALDYGETGGGHGHPDRLNLWLVRDDGRILEDVGTGSYVDPSLHWYRSTLAHNAPLAHGRSQEAVPGELLDYDERETFGWALARARIAPNVDVERAVVAASGYLVDEVRWTGPTDVVFDLPYHVTGEAPSVASWTAAQIAGDDGLEDGFRYVTQSAHAAPASSAQIVAQFGRQRARLWLYGDAPFVLWRLRAPGPPNNPPREFFLLRCVGAPGRIRAVIDWTDAVTDVRSAEDELLIDVAGATHAHKRVGTSWQIDAGGAGRVVLTSGTSVQPAVSVLLAAHPPTTLEIPRLRDVPDAPGALIVGGGAARHVSLGAAHYRRSEQTWDEAGKPRATLALAAKGNDLHLDVDVEKKPVWFAPARAENPLDNEHPDVNSDGIQVHIGEWMWLLVPEEPAPNVRVTLRRSGKPQAPRLSARWRATPAGYSMRITLPLEPIANSDGAFSVDVIVNEISPGRERRRGQLVLSGARGEWIYLRGDRQDATRFLRFKIVDG
ncbi:MAG TPA: heparinase II/III family protein, partial [Gemmatimonadaceae bacterium]|nr:heparinase II/III family protein [Gemmatimonadaceae bacterium]